MIKDYLTAISITVGVIIALIAWLFPNIEETMRFVIAVLALVLPATLVFIRWIYNIKGKLKEIEQNNKQLRNANAQWKRDFKRVEYEKQLLLEYKLSMEMLLQMAAANSKELKFTALLEANKGLNENIDTKVINYKIQEEVKNER